MTSIHFGAASPSDYRPAARPQRILLVDDEPDTVVSLLAVLRHEGYDARGAYDGRSALKEIELFDPDVVVVDIAMPGISGWDVATEVRKKHRSRPTLIAISGTYLKAPDEILCRVAGFQRFLLKPCDPNFLIQVLGAPVMRT